jgi:co-chaperonin GroES (HSP10)
VKIRPLHDWLVVKIDPIPEKKGSIIVMEDSPLNNMRTGTVLRVGPGKNIQGKRVSPGVEAGEKVAFFTANLEHKTGKQLTAFLEGIEEDTGMIRSSDILFVFPAGENVRVG